jgi:hypothetical protein
MPLTCSARGCQADAVWVLLWNNPKLHTPDRRKSWLACEEHRTTLGDFLAARGFLKETVTVEQQQREQLEERPDELPRKPTQGDPLG